ncbi:MAG: hypothetical protein KGQ42_01385 [Alphaproteobacteria bacterium]|nr:hypothetical protein [Alphaproteobacteria bacterium]MDE2340491.1 hypothetical protein [Alphaproteobacteria bacterium]
MRLTPVGIALASLLLLTSSGSIGAPDVSVNPRAQVFVALGNTALAQAQGITPANPEVLDLAEDNYEDALLIAPDYRAALIGMARVAHRQGLNGKAIGYYRTILDQDPKDVDVLALQGEAMVSKGAFIKAGDNLAKIKSLCITACPAQIALGNAIAHGTEAPPLKAAQIESSPVIQHIDSRTN